MVISQSSLFVSSFFARMNGAVKIQINRPIPDSFAPSQKKGTFLSKNGITIPAKNKTILNKKSLNVMNTIIVL